ncbi:MAG: hypothetical protein ACRDIC_17120, partial [bacterium]
MPDRLQRVPSRAGITGVFLFLVLLMMQVPTVASPTPDDTLVMPGLRMGKWTLTMTIDDLVRMHGTPIRVQVQAGLPPAADA